MKNLHTKELQAIGNFIYTIDGDLHHIQNFQKFKNKKIGENDNLETETENFYKFLKEFRVVRNFVGGKTNELLLKTRNFIQGNHSNNVDLFAEILSQSDLTRNNVTTSLASKILFLNNPWEIIPLDKLARNALNQKDNKYETYKKKLAEFEIENIAVIQQIEEYTKPIINVVKLNFVGEIENIDKIISNRILDKILWTKGK